VEIRSKSEVSHVVFWL